jgi:hypothetical protein
MYLEPVEIRNYIVQEVSTPKNIEGSLEISDTGVVFDSFQDENTVFKIPAHAIDSIATDTRRYYTLPQVIGYSLFLMIIIAIGSMIALYHLIGYGIMAISFVPIVFMIYKFYQSKSDVVLVSTNHEVIEFEVTEEQKEEAYNYINYDESDL